MHMLCARNNVDLNERHIYRAHLQHGCSPSVLHRRHCSPCTSGDFLLPLQLRHTTNRTPTHTAHTVCRSHACSASSSRTTPNSLSDDSRLVSANHSSPTYTAGRRAPIP